MSRAKAWKCVQTHGKIQPVSEKRVEEVGKQQISEPPSPLLSKRFPAQSQTWLRLLPSPPMPVGRGWDDVAQESMLSSL
eukprot:2464000-Rhodomonas_salina.2